MTATLRRYGPNLIQAALIRRYADRHGLAVEVAARAWIVANGRMFRAFWDRHTS